MAKPALTDRAFYDFLAQARLMGSQCSKCGSISVPPRSWCKRCHSPDMEWVEVSGRGTLVAFTCISIGPPDMARRGFGPDNPYCSGVIELKEGPRVVARIASVDALHPESISIGLPLAITFDEDSAKLVFEPSS